MYAVLLCKFVVSLVFLISSGYAQSREEWMTQAQQRLKEAIGLRPNVGVARNVILFLGDGMGVSTITAARIHKGQLDGGTGEEYQLTMEKMPYTGLIKTYNTNQQTPDSAGTATAFLSGVKTKAGVLGVDDSVVRDDCTNLQEGSLDTIVDWALAEGKSVGIVTTARVTHATPGAAYAKMPDRDWESDTDIRNAVNCDPSLKDIALQLVENHAQIQVVLGGGRRSFFSNTTADPKDGSMGRRGDGKDLVEIWKTKQTDLDRRHQYVINNDQLKQVGVSNTDSILGLFNPSHLEYEMDRQETGANSEPSISDMTKKAIDILRKNSNGYFLLVEGGRIDHGHHDGYARKALEDAIAMDAAIKTAQGLTNEADTLIMVTADHSHVFNIAGYPSRGNPLLGFIEIEEPSYRPQDGMPMTTIIYGNGPGPQRSQNLSGVDTTDKEFKFPNAVPLSYETHGGEDVAVFASGPMSHLVVGTNEQHLLAHIMGYAACMGPDKSHCSDPGTAQFCPDAASNLVISMSTVVISWLLAVLLA